MAVSRAAALATFGFAVTPGASLKAISQVQSGKNRPVMKVVRLLQDMQQQLEAELADDKAVHEQLDCWCEDNEREKTKAIEVNEARETELETFLGEAAARMKEMTVKRNAARDEADKDFAALEEAKNLRMKEAKEFQRTETNLMEAVQACGQALVVLKEYHPDAAGLTQVRAVAQKLQEVQILALSKHAVTNVSPTQLSALKSFLQDAGAGSFLAVPDYAPQSGQIFGILGQMKSDFEKDLSDAQAKEKKDIEDFEALRDAKQEEIDTGRALVTNLDGQIAELKAKHAQAFKELEDTKAQLELDRTFLNTLKKKCSESEAQFEQRVKDRLEEIAAVTDTIRILNSDDTFAKMEAVNSFLQISSSEQEAKEEKDLRKRAAISLQRAGAKLKSPTLLLLATDVQRDAFKKVKKAIDKMVAELTQQQQDEVEHRDMCLKEMHQNELDTNENEDKKENLEVKIADLEKQIKELAQEIENNVASIAEMQKQMKRASEVREAENRDFQQTVNDQRITQMILKKALERISATYALLQAPEEQQQPGAPHIQTSGTHTDPGNGPARFTSYSKNAGGARVIAMLETVIQDSAKMENDAMRAEENAQEDYQGFMKDSNEAITVATDKIVTMKKAKAVAEEDHTEAKSDHADTVETLKGLAKTLADLHGSCDFVLKNFDDRQEARLGEINALKEAKAILSGMK